METSEVFYTLLRERKIKSASPEYAWYLENLRHQESLHAMAQAFECRILDRSKALWLIPTAGNGFLGFTRTDLKKRLCRSNQKLTHYYLYMFMLLVLLNAFYGTEYAQGRLRQYLKMDEWMNQTCDALDAGADRDENKEKHPEIPFEMMRETYTSLRPEIDHPDRSGYRIQMHRILLRFLVEQELAVYMEKEQQIFVTERMDVLMDDLLRTSPDLTSIYETFKGD